MNSDITLASLRKTKIEILIQKLYSDGQITAKQEHALYKTALTLLNSSNENVKDYGYRIILKFCNITRNYVPLYDIASNLGFIPILNLLKAKSLLPPKTNFLSTFMDAYSEVFRENGIYQTESQRQLFYDFEESIENTVAVVAPTSYGKSELIEQTVRNHKKSNLAIIVPSKALISQTRTRVTQASGFDESRRIIIHHDMSFEINKPVIAIMTQERILRALQKFPTLSFDLIFVDEAHNLLSGDGRSRLLGSALMINEFRRPNCAVKFLTPFLSSSESLRLINQQADIPELRIKERLKTEEYYLCEIRGQQPIRLYDQFLNKYFPCGKELYTDTYEFLIKNQSRKNIVYLNKPKDIERSALKLSGIIKGPASEQVDKLCAEIADYVHPDYKLLQCLRAGVAYHHGSVPDVVRNYVEKIFKDESTAAWIITNSTLLEGVNIPAQKLFILDHRKGQGNLSLPQFRNLSGRVNRFSDVFHERNGTPALLIPEIYLVECEFTKKNSNLENYLSNVAKIDKKFDDELKNPLLYNTEEDDEINRKRADDFTFIENIEPNARLRDTPRLSKTNIGRLCYAHNVFEINIELLEEKISLEIDNLKAEQLIITDAKLLMQTVSKIFVSKIDESNPKHDKNLMRLKHPSAQNFYAMFFDWRINQMNYGRMIASFIAYWQKKASDPIDAFAYVGRWGDTIRDGGHVEHYVNLRMLSEYEMINLAIVRIKEEQDFVDNTLLKFLEILNDVGLVEKRLYNVVKYGTQDDEQIALIRNGFTHIAATTLISKYRKYITVTGADKVSIDGGILSAFKTRGEKDLIIFEIESSGFVTPPK